MFLSTAEPRIPKDLSKVMKLYTDSNIHICAPSGVLPSLCQQKRETIGVKISSFICITKNALQAEPITIFINPSADYFLNH